MTISTIEELEEFKNEQFDKVCGDESKVISICMGSSCLAIGAQELKDEIEKELKEQDTTKKCRVRGVGCNGFCSNGPFVGIGCKGADKDEVLYEKTTKENAKEFVASVINNTKLEDKICDTNSPFFAKQHKIVLENSGLIDPESIEEYIMRDGYKALFMALNEMSRENVIEEMKISGLRGRGGGGYPTGLKWETVAKTDSQMKYIVCNGDEGDPGAFMDRSVMESDPHRVLEGMAIAGYACGAEMGYIYVRAEYPLAAERLKKAIKQAQKLGILGSKIAGTNFRFDVEIRLGGGAFVCGEATALVTSIEGNRGNPRQKPPHLSDKGLWGRPTILNNVETFANVPPIIRNGGAWYSSIGTEKSKGTKVFALSGQVKYTGLVEIPMGTSLREIIFEIGGGMAEGREFKAVQTGGPSGGCIPKEHLDIGVDYESLKKIGSIMGSGGMIVMDDTSSMVEVAKYFMDFCVSESCGKCTPCRVGTSQLHILLEKFANQEATEKDLEIMVELCELVKETSLCGLGQTAPNPVLSTLRYFRDEYLAGMRGDK